MPFTFPDTFTNKPMKKSDLIQSVLFLLAAFAGILWGVVRVLLG